MRCTRKSPKPKAFWMDGSSYCCGKTRDKSNSEKRLFWFIVWEYCLLWDGRLEQEAHGTLTVGKQRKISGVLFALSLWFSPGAQPMGWVLLQLSLPGNNVTGMHRGITSEWL